MNAPDSPTVAGPSRRGDGRLARGLDTRARLLDVALRLFAEKGYAQTSTREICVAAGVNAASIHYYFSDKAGLYRAVYLAPIQQLMIAARDDRQGRRAFRSHHAQDLRGLPGAAEARRRQDDADPEAAFSRAGRSHRAGRQTRW